ncbi:MAG: DUF4097 family beta strand repeat-containing protein [Acidobacteria bacterium]|nr:DUF4097 family beta strand repeat-containing protein [Acidobacteriota bacterium]
MIEAEKTKTHAPGPRRAPRGAAARRALASCAAAFALALSFAHAASAQKKVSNTYKLTRPTVRLQLMNRSGSVEIEGWDRREIKVTAEMESPAARFTPVMNDDGLLVDVVGDTKGRENVGDVNFKIQVPADAEIDVKTTVGNISVRNVRGSMLFAVTREGDIDLTGVRAMKVIASNISGSILFDAELMGGGTYDLKSTSGQINVRITGGSGFTLTATAPRTRNIDLGGFAARGKFDFSDSRRVWGRVGDGSAILNATNLRGSIVFVSR